ncbi:MAG TPA: hypothetical protein VFU13_17665 [Steroidobacteraceae bacterium]|nr:hypothetical protein [Steroidobacteraceae bacterium]
MWRQIRIAFLLLLLGVAAYSNWYDRLSTTDWDETLYVGLFPVTDPDGAVARHYIAGLSEDRIADIEQFLNEEAQNYGVGIASPVRVELYPPVDERPPERDADAGILQNMWWSLKVRMYARRAARASGRPPPQVRIFVIYHDPSFTQTVPHSVGMQKGLVGVVHAFADAGMTRTNNVVIAHEILHTLGATDKYDLQSLEPLFPIGYAEPERKPLYPQSFAEIMAGRYAVDARTFEMPESLDQAVVGEATALEIRWIRP